MPDILVRDVSPGALARLKARAKRRGRSLQSEVKRLLEEAGGMGGNEVAAMLDKWRGRFASRRLSSSVKLIREDRER